MADDAGALLVRSGLVSSNALDDARARVASHGGTLGEQLVTTGAITDDALTDFYRSRLLVPQVNPNMLARLTPEVVAAIPSDMAIELRAIPVLLDRDNNLTVAMSDPSDSHAVDEIAAFTGAYIVRAAATQMQIAWCLAHYYGHVTALGQRLLRGSQSSAPIKAAISAVTHRGPRIKGVTGKVTARHRAVAPVTGPVDAPRPGSGEIDLRPLESAGASLPRASSTGHGPAVQPSAGSDSASPAGSAGAEPAGAAGSASTASAKPKGAAGAKPAGASAASAPGSADARPTGATGSASTASAKPKGAAGAKPAGASAASAAGSADAKPAGGAGSTGAAGAKPAGAAAGSPTAKRATPPNGAGSAGASGAAAVIPARSASSKLAGPAGTASPPLPAATAASGSTGTGAADIASPPARPAAATDGASSSAASGPPAGGPSATPPPAPAPHPAPPVGFAGAPEPAAGHTGVGPGAGTPPRLADPPTPPAARAPAGVQRAPAAAAGPNARMMLPGVFPAIDDGIPRPMLDEALPAPALDDALPMPVLEDEASARMALSPDILVDGDDPEEVAARTISGEIREALQRAQIRTPPARAGEADSGPLITIEQGGGNARLRRRRAVKSDPPELYARAGEVDLKASTDRAIDLDEPRIVIDEDALAPPTGRFDVRAARPADAPPATAIDVADDADTGAADHDGIVDLDSQPILLDRPRRASEQVRAIAEPAAAATPATGAVPDARAEDDDADTGQIEVVVLDAPKRPRLERPRPERRTRIGVTPAPVSARQHPDTEATGVAVLVEHREIDHATFEDPTPVDLRAAAGGQRAAPPAPDSDHESDTNPRLVAPRPASPAPPGPRTRSIPPAVIVDDGDRGGDEDDVPGPHAAERAADELDGAIPGRSPQSLPEPRRRLEYDAVDDGWGPPGTTIPPPLLGAIPGSDDDDGYASAIPMPNVDSSPLIVSPPSPAEPEGKSLIRELEGATARAIEVIRQLELTEGRDEIVDLMISYLAETHYRAGFLVTRHPAASRQAGELGLFAMTPPPQVMPSATLRLDRPSTLQDIVGTRLPYRGPMHDDASRSFLISILGACPPEILLVPVAVRERVVGVLFGEHRLRHTFDDQLALAARAAGMAFERILRTKRG